MKNSRYRTVIVMLIVLVADAMNLESSQAECNGEKAKAKVAERQDVKPKVESLEVGLADTPKIQPNQSVWMRVKLNRANGILEGLARADFVSIRHNANVMNQFGRLERWAHVKNEDYQTHMQAFDQANRDLIRQAGDENLEGVTLAFFQLTTSCANCHRVVRDHEELFQGNVEEITHIVKVEAEYYFNGPQQARPADGTFASGTVVAVMDKAGSYWVVLSENGVKAFVSADALKEIDVKAASDAK